MRKLAVTQLRCRDWRLSCKRFAWANMAKVALPPSPAIAGPAKRLSRRASHVCASWLLHSLGAGIGGLAASDLPGQIWLRWLSHPALPLLARPSGLAAELRMCAQAALLHSLGAEIGGLAASDLPGQIWLRWLSHPALPLLAWPSGLAAELRTCAQAGCYTAWVQGLAA